MLPSAITKKLLESWGGEFVFADAEKAVNRGRVLRADMKGDFVSGEIGREDGGIIYSKFKIRPDGTVDSLCPCYTNQKLGQVCYHVVALGITLMRRHSDPLREQKYQEELRRSRRMAEVDPASYVQRSQSGCPAVIQLKLFGDWVGEFQSGREINFGINFVGSRNGASLGACPQQTLSISAEDEALLSVLEDVCVGPPQAIFEVSARDALNIFNVAKHLQIETDAGPLEVEAHEVAVSVQVDVDHRTGELLVFPVVKTPSHSDSSKPVFIVGQRGGFVLENGHLWPMKQVLPLPYHELYRNQITVPRERVINFLDHELPNLKNATPMQLEVPPSLFARIPANPVFLLEVCGTPSVVRAILRVKYGDRTLTAVVPDPQGELSIPDPDDILCYRVRNMPSEMNALAKLAKLGFQNQNGNLVLMEQRNVLDFVGSSYPALKRNGWKVTFSGSVNGLVEELLSVIPVVKIADAGNGYFDVGYTFEGPNGGGIPPAEVQRALNCGDSYVVYKGRTLLFDDKAIAAMRGIFNDCPSRPSRTPGHFLLPDIYAPFVQSSLTALEEAICVECPDSWRELAERKNRVKNSRIEPEPLGDLETTLRPYQKYGVYWLRFLEKSGMCGLLADEMGLGKTLQTLCWISLRRASPEAQGKPALVVCPTSLVANWAREAQIFVPHLKALVLSGTERKDRFAEIPQSDLVVTSYALIRRDQEEYAPYRFSVAVLDEAQHIKNRNTRNALAAKQICAANKLVLTGTPIENSVADIWSIMDFLMPNYLGKYDDFKINYELPIAAAGDDGEAAQEKLRRKLHPFILRRLKKQVAKDLPDKIVKVSYCQMTQEQQQVYDRLLAESRRRVGDMVRDRGFDHSRFEILAILMRLRQVCCHLGLLNDGKTPPRAYSAPSAKTEAFFELLDEAIDGGHRVLVFSQFVKMLNLLRCEFESRGIQYCYLDGSTKDRLEQCQRFNLTPSIPVFLISLKAGGTGLNLTGADMVVHFDPWWNPAVEDQATDRAHRIGQKRTVYSIKMITEDTIEEKVLAMQRKKQAVINAIIGATDQSVMQQLTYDDIKDLLGL